MVAKSTDRNAVVQHLADHQLHQLQEPHYREGALSEHYHSCALIA
jgi:hypothetical protein